MGRTVSGNIYLHEWLIFLVNVGINIQKVAWIQSMMVIEGSTSGWSTEKIGSLGSLVLLGCPAGT